MRWIGFFLGCGVYLLACADRPRPDETAAPTPRSVGAPGSSSLTSSPTRAGLALGALTCGPSGEPARLEITHVDVTHAGLTSAAARPLAIGPTTDPPSARLIEGPGGYVLIDV